MSTALAPPPFACCIACQAPCALWQNVACLPWKQALCRCAMRHIYACQILPINKTIPGISSQA